MSSMNCTSCGAPLEIENRFSKVLVCGYCGTHLKVSGESLDISGKHPKLAEFPSIFNVGTTGTILGKPFKALGRMRYRTDDSYYDEWFLDYEGETAWFVEDEGTYAIFFEMFEAADLPDPGTIRAGQNIEVAGKRVMVKEKGTSVVEGGEGELSYYQEPGTRVTYIDGVAEGQKISIETTEDEVEIFTGKPLLKRDIVVGG